MKKRLLLFIVVLTCALGARADNDSTYTWYLGEYPYYFYCHDWPAAFLGDNVVCRLTVRGNADDVGEAATALGGYSVREYAELFHTDDSLDVIGVATGQIWEAFDTVAVTLYDSSMNELAVMYVPEDKVNVNTYNEQEVFIRLIPGVATVYEYIPFFYEVPIKDDIGKIIGDFYIGMKVISNLYQYEHFQLPNCLFELDENTWLWPPYMPHDPPYHYEGHQYRLKVGDVWDTLRTSHFMPLLFPIYNPWCKAPDRITASPIENGCIDVHWDTDAIPASWEVCLMEGPSMTYDTTMYTTSDTSLHICGLNPNVNYTLRIRSLCISDDESEKWSAWSVPVKINRQSVGIPLMAPEPECSIMPNPAHGNVTVQCGEGIEKVELLTVKGERILYQEMTGKQTCTLDLGGLAKGVYIVQVTTARGTAARKLAVE